MRKVALWLSLALLVAGLAGCAGSDDETDDGDDATDGGNLDGGTGNTDGGDGDAGGDDGDDGDAGGDDGDAGGDDGDGDTSEEDLAPTASLTADVGTGAPGLEVTFSLDGSDPEGAAITWTFDADGDGTNEEEGEELPASATFTYDETGEYAAKLVVSDGTQETNATLTIIIEVGQEELPAPIVFSGQVSPVECKPVNTSDPTANDPMADAHWEYDAVLAGDWLWKRDSSGGMSTHFYSGADLVESVANDKGKIPAGTDNLLICPSNLIPAPAGDVVWVGGGPAPLSYTQTLFHPDHPDAPAVATD